VIISDIQFKVSFFYNKCDQFRVGTNLLIFKNSRKVEDVTTGFSIIVTSFKISFSLCIMISILKMLKLFTITGNRKAIRSLREIFKFSIRAYDHKSIELFRIEMQNYIVIVCYQLHTEADTFVHTAASIVDTFENAIRHEHHL
jgi:hypothetical protein